MVSHFELARDNLPDECFPLKSKFAKAGGASLVHTTL